MATSSSPTLISSSSKHLIHILRRSNNPDRTISPWPRIFRRNLKLGFDFNNIVNVYVRGFASVSASTLPVVTLNHHRLRKDRHCFRVLVLSLLPLRRSCSSYRWIVLMAHSEGSENGGGGVTQDSIKTVRCVIKGRVQGVFYRNWTVENATQLGLKGWVRNKRDGSVEALFSGKPEAVDDMQQRCRRGPPDALVTGLEAYPCNDDPGIGFERRRTA